MARYFLATQCRSTPYQLRNGEQAEAVYPVPSRGPLDSNFRQLFTAAGQARRPVLVHCEDVRVFDELLPLHRDTTFIWAHADHSVGDWTFEPLAQRLQNHPNLYYETGFCLRRTYPGERLSYLHYWHACWIPLLEQFPGRLTFGSDAFAWPHVEPEPRANLLYTGAREIEQQLSPAAARMWLGGALARLVGEEWG